MMPHELLNQSSTLRVVAMRIQEMGTYNDQYLRPYTTDVSQATMNKVVNLASEAKDRGEQITTLGLAAVNDGRPLVTPSTQPEGLATIANGWRERRFRFLMTVDQDFGIGGMNRFYFTGYSTHADHGYNGALDMDMQFYINSAIRTRFLEAVTPMAGLVKQENAVSNRHVIANNNWEGGMSPNQLYMLRPEDVYTTIHLGNTVRGGTDVYNDTRIQAQRTASMSDVNNNLAHNYAAKIINTYVAASSAQPTYANDSQNVITDAQKLCYSTVDNPLIVALSRVRDHGFISNSFTLKDLCRIDPNAYNQIQFFPLSPNDYGSLHSSGMTSDWHGQDGATMAAIKICQSVPALMGAMMLQNIAFTSTNSTMDAMFTTKVSFADSMNKMDIPQRCQGFVTRFEQEILRDITVNNNISYYLEVRADAFGETWVKISFNNGAMYEYVVPSFCDNLISPIITPNNQHAMQLSSDFGSLLSDIGENYAGSTNFNLIGTNV